LRSRAAGCPYRDTKRRLELDGTVQTATGKAPGNERAELKLTSRLEGQSLALHFIGGSVLMLREQQRPYPLRLDVDYGATKLALEGTV
jgi:AsmA family protein